MKALLKRLEKIDKELVNDVDKIVQANGSEMAQTARRLAPSNFGDLRKSIRKTRQTKKSELAETSVRVGVRYGAYVEFGTGGYVSVPAELREQATAAKNLPKGSFAKGLASITRWVKAKGIDEDAAYPIFMSILRKGIKPQPFMWPALILQRRQLTADIDKYLKKKFNL